MKAITILQPFASLIAIGKKRLETRSWETKYRGPIAIHSGIGSKYIKLSRSEPFYSSLWDENQREMLIKERENSLPYGCIIAIADLTHCLKINDSQIYYLEKDKSKELSFGFFAIGRYAWELANVRQITPVPAKGMQRLWEWEVTS